MNAFRMMYSNSYLCVVEVFGTGSHFTGYPNSTCLLMHISSSSSSTLVRPHWKNYSGLWNSVCKCKQSHIRSVVLKEWRGEIMRFSDLRMSQINLSSHWCSSVVGSSVLSLRPDSPSPEFTYSEEVVRRKQITNHWGNVKNAN